MYPFIESNISVVKAKYLFPVLKTFVAPIFPDPIFLISCPLKNFVIIKPKGIEPHKYENKDIIKKSIYKLNLFVSKLAFNKCFCNLTL